MVGYAVNVKGRVVEDRGVAKNNVYITDVHYLPILPFYGKTEGELFCEITKHVERLLIGVPDLEKK